MVLVVQASGIEYEFDLWGKLDLQNNLKIEKSRYSKISGQTFPKPGAEFCNLLLGWIYPWTLWRNDQDAINWAANILPDMEINEIKKEYINLHPENGQKFPTWVNYVHNLDKF